jgi:mono/diheme cytochrome c family protein
LKILRPTIAIATLCGFWLMGCGSDQPKTDAELGLTAEQAAGRQVFDKTCSTCHQAYSSSGSKGPGLKGLFKKQALPSGLPANDRFVEGTIMGGRGMMPPLGNVLSQNDLKALMDYLHTL